MHGSIHLFEDLPQVDAIPAAQRDLAPAPVRAQPLVGLIRNARSHRNESRSAREELHEDILLATPRTRDELPAILADFAARRVDYLAIDGGDGTVRDVLTCGAGIFGDSWPELILIPSGKTNALANNLGVPVDWSLAQALDAARRGTHVRRHPLVIAQRENERAQVRGFIMGAGAFTQAIALGQRSHDLGAFNTAVVAVTAGWSVLQAFFGSARNAWRRGTPMRLSLADGSELAHFGGLPVNERYMLIASTLARFPAGLDPFRGIEGPMRVAVFDNVSRGLMLRLFSVARGTTSARTRQRGYHVFGEAALDLDIGDSFILDGEAFPAGQYRLSAGPALRFIVP